MLISTFKRSLCLFLILKNVEKAKGTSIKIRLIKIVYCYFNSDKNIEIMIVLLFGAHYVFECQCLKTKINDKDIFFSTFSSFTYCPSLEFPSF